MQRPPVRSVVDQLVGDDLSDPGADGVHTPDPGEGIGGFEGLGDALGAGELGGQLVRHLPGLLVDLGEMSVQLAVVEQGVVEGAALLLQVVCPPSAPQAQGRRGGLVLPGDQVAVAHQFVVEAGPVIVDKAFHSVLLFGHIALGRVRGGWSRGTLTSMPKSKGRRSFMYLVRSVPYTASSTILCIS